MKKKHMSMDNGRQVYYLTTGSDAQIILTLEVRNSLDLQSWKPFINGDSIEQIEPVASAAMYGACDAAIGELQKLIVEIEQAKVSLSNGDKWGDVEIV